MDLTEKIFGIISAVALAFSLGPIIVKKVQSRKEDAETDESRARTESLNVSTAKDAVALAKQLLEESEEDRKEKGKQLDTALSNIRDLQRRVNALEENERITLMWAAESKVWSAEAYKRLAALNIDVAEPPRAPWETAAERVTRELGMRVDLDDYDKDDSGS